MSAAAPLPTPAPMVPADDAIHYGLLHTPSATGAEHAEGTRTAQSGERNSQFDSRVGRHGRDPRVTGSARLVAVAGVPGLGVERVDHVALDVGLDRVGGVSLRL